MRPAIGFHVEQSGRSTPPGSQVTKDKLETYERSAEVSGKNFSQWVRGVLDTALVKTK